MFSESQRFWIVTNSRKERGFWGAAEAEVFQKKPKTIPELKAIVETYASRIPRDILLRVADNFMERAKICNQEDGGHLEHLLKKNLIF